MHQQVPQRIGLTGGIGSGKSTVARMLQACGATLVDADAIARQVTAPRGSAIEQLVSQFGSQVIGADGAMDRNHMRQLAFNNQAIKQALEAIIHPLINQESKRQIDLAVQAGSKCIVFDIPLLVESGRWRRQLDQVLVVDCRESSQIDRVMRRNSWTEEVVKSIMVQQASRLKRLESADVCVYNDELSVDALSLVVQHLAPRFGLSSGYDGRTKHFP